MRAISYSKRMRLALMLLFSPALAFSATSKTATIGINAEVLPACSAGSTNVATLGQFGTLDFGTHFALGSAVTATAQGSATGLRINCILNTPYSVLISAGSSGNVNARRMVGPGAQTLAYNLYTNASYVTVWNNSTGVSGTGTGANQYLPVYGRVPAQSVPVAGTYSDTVTVTVSW